ncbi:MAG: DEAD/DEAH box helicase [Pseudomonadales bacterium]|nr:DEAD/DEAH box helicase [Pseudomonadales bacterium]
MSFDSLGLSTPLLKAVAEQGYDTPSPIQEQAIPAVLGGQDVMAAAQTGTGKTAGFTLPLLQRLSKGNRPPANHVRALVLTPTRELAAQVGDSVALYGKHLSLSSAVVFGGVKINPQMMKLRKGVDVLVATPGRLLDLHTKNALKLGQIEILVLDEADRMLDMGFINDIKKILALMPKRRQNLMFSATFSNEIRQLAKGLVNEPVEISVSPQNSTATTIHQWVIPVDRSRKSALLIELIKTKNWFQVLVFSKTKHGANKISYQLEKAGIKSAAIHGNKSQGARTRALAEFKKGDIQVLVATDIAARGLDIDQLPQVVNYDLPHVAEDYVHRIGRTGRAGSEGQAVSLVCAAEAKELFGIERLIQQVLPRRGVPGFTPKEKVPESSSQLKPPKVKKPKKPKKTSNNKQKRVDHKDGSRSDKASSKKQQNNEKINESVWGKARANASKSSGNNTQRRRPKGQQ